MYCITLVSFRLFCKNLGNLKEFFAVCCMLLTMFTSNNMRTVLNLLLKSLYFSSLVSPHMFIKCVSVSKPGRTRQEVIQPGLLIFRAVAEPQISSKSANPVKFTKTREIPRNSLEILPNTCWHNIFESYLGCWGCLLAVNLLIYLETSSPQRVNNIPKRLAFLDYVAKNWEATM